ncbi:unnamed protein product, partial [Musa acuminata var. zebrina]
KISSVSHPSRVVVTPRHHERRCSIRLHHGFRKRPSSSPSLPPPRPPAPPFAFRCHRRPAPSRWRRRLRHQLSGLGIALSTSPARHRSRWAISPKVDGWRARRGQR